MKIKIKITAFLFGLMFLFTLSCRKHNLQEDVQFKPVVHVYSQTYEEPAPDTISTAEKEYEGLITFFDIPEPSEIIYNKVIDQIRLGFKDESLSEDFGQRMYTMLETDPAKRARFFGLVNKRSEAEQEIIFDNLVKLICLDIVEDKMNIEVFRAKFPELAGGPNVIQIVKNCLINFR